MREALDEYRRCSTYWYVPKARTLSDENVEACARTLRLIFDEFLGEPWDQETQSAILTRLIEEGMHEAQDEDASQQDRLALLRITKVLLETLGLLWVEEDQTPLITDAGFALMEALEDKEDPRPLIEAQVAKLQFPNPQNLKRAQGAFEGVLPHLFLLQVLSQVDYQLSRDEYELFVNLAQAQSDVDRIAQYVKSWRGLDNDQRAAVRDVFGRVPMRPNPTSKLAPLLPIAKGGSKGSRAKRISLNASYQHAFFCYPTPLGGDSSEEWIRCESPGAVEALIQAQLDRLKVTAFENRESWFAYFGDPQQRPSWFTHLSLAIEAASSVQEAEDVVSPPEVELSEEEKETLVRLQREKAIEAAYAEQLDKIEDGLKLLERQHQSPIGRMDLLCRGVDGKYVVVEVKADEARDAVFGQILRYMGWIHTNFEDGAHNVRGVILASRFPETARYSRIGLLKEDSEQYLQFCRHRMAFEED